MRNRSSRYSLCFSQHFFPLWNISTSTVISIFLGILLQAIPFYSLAFYYRLLSKCFCQKKVIQRWFPPKNALLGMLFALYVAFVCRFVGLCKPFPCLKV